MQILRELGIDVHFRISKYNPEHRDEKGSYLKDDWTSVTDIGKFYADGVLTLETYLKTEDAYWDTVRKLFRSCHIDSMIIKDLEIYEDRLEDIPAELQEASKARMAKIKNEDSLSIEGLEYVFRLALKELIWCKLFGEDGTYLHFGYDYYIYFGSDRLRGQEMPLCEPMIFIEPYESPYL